MVGGAVPGTTDLDGRVVIDETLTDDEWRNLTSLHDELGRYCLEELGLKLTYHSHADSHVGTQAEIIRLQEELDTFNYTHSIPLEEA